MANFGHPTEGVHFAKGGAHYEIFFSSEQKVKYVSIIYYVPSRKEANLMHLWRVKELVVKVNLL